MILKEKRSIKPRGVKEDLLVGKSLETLTGAVSVKC